MGELAATMDEEDVGSISACFAKLIAGESEALQVLWERYFVRLQDVARKQLGSLPRRSFDEEDVALSVLECLCRGAADGRFTSVKGSTELWKLLVTITKQKSIDRIRREMTLRRGGGRTQDETQRQDNEPFWRIEEVLESGPTPAELVEMEEQNRHLLSILRDGSLRRVAVSRLDGYTTAEIAERLGVTVRSVERKLRLIRETWQLELSQS